MERKNVTQVVIDGKIYKLGGYESEEYLHQVASYLNNKITELKSLDGYLHLPAAMKSLMLDLNTADDYFKVKKQADRLENAAHDVVVLEFGEEHRDQQDDQQGGEDGPDGGHDAALQPLDLMAGEDGHVDGQDARRALRQDHDVLDVLVGDPAAPGHLLLDEREHRVAAADGESPHLGEHAEQFPERCILHYGYKVTRLTAEKQKNAGRNVLR